MPRSFLQRSFRSVLFTALLLGSAAGFAMVVQTPTGDVDVRTRAAGDRLPKEGIGRGRIGAPPERVFRALNDVAHWHEFMPFLEQSDAQRMKDGTIVSFQRLDLPFPLGRRSYRIRFRSRVERTPSGPVWHADWTYVPGSGNIRGHYGSWILIAAGPSATLATCSLYTDPGGMVPRSAIERGMTETLPWIFHGLRQHVRRSRYDGPDATSGALRQTGPTSRQ